MSAIYDAFCTAVQAFASVLSPPLPVAWPNLPFTPPNSGLWLEVSWFPNGSSPVGLAFADDDWLQGFGQVAVCFPSKSGLTAGEEMADAIIAGIPRGTRFASALVYRSPSKMNPIQEPNRVTIPVTIMWSGASA